MLIIGRGLGVDRVLALEDTSSVDVVVYCRSGTHRSVGLAALVQANQSDIAVDHLCAHVWPEASYLSGFEIRARGFIGLAGLGHSQCLMRWWAQAISPPASTIPAKINYVLLRFCPLTIISGHSFLNRRQFGRSLLSCGQRCRRS